MRYRDAVAFRQALEQRLRDGAAGDGALLARDRKRVVFERFLSRLLVVAPGSWMLKGGFALDLRLPGWARATRGVDPVAKMIIVANLAPPRIIDAANLLTVVS